MTELADKEKWLNINEDDILNKMTEEELEQLNYELMEMDPDNCMLAAGFRQRDHTTKAPTGPLDREGLLAHLEEEAKAIEDKEELVPFEPGKKRGKVFVKKDVNQDDGFGGGPVKLAPEIEEALKNATDGELTDLAAILGLHTLMDNEQYYASLSAVDGKIANTVGFREATKCKLPVADPEELAAVEQNDTDVDETLQKMKMNDGDLTVVNLNNM